MYNLTTTINPPYQHRILRSGVEVELEIRSASVTRPAGAGEGISLGESPAAQLTLTAGPGLKEGDEITYQVGGDAGWIPLGTFTILTAQGTDGVYTYTGADPMAVAMESLWAATDCTTALEVMTAIADQCRLKFDSQGLTDVTLPRSPTAGPTCRELAGQMAALFGGNAVIDRLGRLTVLVWQLDSAAFAVTADETYAGEMELGAQSRSIQSVSCTVETEVTAAEDDLTTTETTSETLTAGTPGAPGISIANPYMTQTLLEGIWEALAGRGYYSGSVGFIGHPELDPGDVLTVQDREGNSYLVPIMQLDWTLDGGLRSTAQAFAQSEAENQADYSGPMTQEMERMTADLASFKQLYAKNLQAESARIKQLESDVINAGDLNAVNADIKNLQADVANIETVLAGNVGADNVQTVHLTSENVVIDDAIITDAMISDLTAGKITAGTLYTTLVKIASDEDENLLIDGSTIQIKDAAGTVRVQIGKDGNGDYNYYLWDADGKLMWSPTGVTADGLNNGIIKDINVADDAAIDGGKLDISSVAEKLNEDGSLTVTAGQVTIDNTTLDVSYKELTERVSETEETTHTLETDFTVIQGQVESKVWQSDIKEVTDPMGEKITTLEDRYSTINQTVNGISLAVGAVQTETAEAQSTADAASQSAADAQSTANSAQTTADANAESIKAVEAKLELKIDEDRLVSQLNASADEINITGDRLVIDSTYFKLAANGEVECTKGTFNGRVYSDSVIFSTGKQYLGDGLAGVGLSSGFVEICSDESPMIRFNRKNATDGTTYIVERADGVMTLSPNVEVTDGLTIGGFAVPKIQYGRESVTAGSDFDVTFPIAFPGYATITLTVNCNTYKIYYARIKTNSPTGFTARVDNLTNSDADTVTVHWMAMY